MTAGMRIGIAVALVLAAVGTPQVQAVAPAAQKSCAQSNFEGHRITVCAFDAARARVQLFHADRQGNVLGDFSAVVRESKRQGTTLRFAMNAGMYHADRAPVGLYVEDGRRIRPLVTGRGKGNFSMLPNGVFFVDRNGAGVMETRAYRKSRIRPQHATQSGPMLVIEGRLHPRFRARSDNRKIRNGVGVSRDRKRLWFAIADDPVNFHTFARFFRDRLGARNALYLDGSISRLYAPEIGREDFGMPMGPIVGIVD